MLMTDSFTAGRYKKSSTVVRPLKLLVRVWRSACVGRPATARVAHVRWRRRRERWRTPAGVLDHQHLQRARQNVQGNRTYVPPCTVATAAAVSIEAIVGSECSTVGSVDGMWRRGRGVDTVVALVIVSAIAARGRVRVVSRITGEAARRRDVWRGARSLRVHISAVSF